ncbi:glycosyltransferase family 9 protein [Paracnuella aquatica]|uniref:glycosyltransferase family 9 protein n=1 Tax=Paracnuella aquatica TaxID=2268757 RepID=UPI000DEFBC57|nr:glycosyltransferase family 9 protein [Paracnuella aquatica]RPD43629.1 lipopolysaccharide heptosyltransferase family protein [Paracnuella aquatica]
MNILVILPPALYDVVSSTALLRCVHRQVADAQLHVVVPEELEFGLEANPAVNRLVPVKELHANLSPQKYDLVMDVAHLEENEHWAAAAGISYLSFKKPSLWSGVFEWFRKKRKQYTALDMVRLAQPIGVQYDGGGLDYFIAPAHQVPQQDVPAAHSAGFVALALGQALTIQPDVLRHFCSQLQFPIIITGGKALHDAAQRLAEEDNIKVYNACGKFTDAESADLLRRARVVVAGDAGWIQVAAAFAKPVVAWYEGKEAGVELTPFYAAAPNGGKTPGFELLQINNNAGAKEHAATGARLVQSANSLLAQK